MRIAFVSYEYPFNEKSGGIGTYVSQIAAVMTNLKHDVEVFTGTSADSYSQNTQGYKIHFINNGNKREFKHTVLREFHNRHKHLAFDIMESAEFAADGLVIKKAFPQLPLIVKLHTPTWLINQLNKSVSFRNKVNFILGEALRGKISKRYWKYKKEEDEEYQITVLANGVYSPSKSLAELIQKKWKLPLPETIPNPFIVSDEILQILLPNSVGERKNIVVAFIGRLEMRKGVIDLAKSIPLVLKENLNINFLFIGSSHPAPGRNSKELMDEYLKGIIGLYQSNVQFLGYQPNSSIPHFLAKTDICVFPSIWENFPNVCLEAMAAGRAVIGSRSGGMADMIKDGINGLLIPPSSPRAIADAILRLVNNPKEIETFGKAAREKVLKEYNAVRIGRLTETFYKEAIRSTNKKSNQS